MTYLMPVRLNKLTNILVALAVGRYDVVEDGVAVEVERLELVEEELSHVLFHVSADHAPVIVVDHAPAVHHL